MLLTNYQFIRLYTSDTSDDCGYVLSILQEIFPEMTLVENEHTFTTTTPLNFGNFSMLLPLTIVFSPTHVQPDRMFIDCSHLRHYWDADKSYIIDSLTDIFRTSFNIRMA